MSTKEPFKCVINQGIILGEVSLLALHNELFLIGFEGEKTYISLSLRSSCLKLQVQYMACRDSNGNLISAESAETTAEYYQVKIPEEKVLSLELLNANN